VESLSVATALPDHAASGGSAALLRSMRTAALITALLLPTARPAVVPSARAGAGLTEYEIKASYLVHFFAYVRWPVEAFEGPEAPFVLLVVGKDPFGETLEETLRGKRIGRRGIEIRRSPDLDDLPQAHMLFLARDHSKDLPHLLERCSGSSTMIVADAPGLAERGAVLGFFLAERHVRFEVNVDAARRADLGVSSQLLKLARVVHDARQDGGRE
jgi:hypothetical protein